MGSVVCFAGRPTNLRSKRALQRNCRDTSPTLALAQHSDSSMSILPQDVLLRIIGRLQARCSPSQLCEHTAIPRAPPFAYWTPRKSCWVMHRPLLPGSAKEAVWTGCRATTETAAWQARDICAVAATCRRLRADVADAPHLFEKTARCQTAVGILEGVMRRAAADTPEVLLLLRQMPTVVGPERQPEGKALKVDWRRACLEYDEEVLRTYTKR